MKRLVVLPILFIFLSASSAFSQDAELERVIDALQQRYDQITDLSAEFQQASTIRALGQTKKSTGLASFKKPGMMRWDYKGKEGQKIISDGRTLWMYFPQDNQVQVSRFSGAWAGRTPTAFLAGLGNLRRDFIIAFADQEKRDARGNYRLLLTPREPLAQVSKLILTVDKESFYVLSTSFTDSLGNLTEIGFKKIKVNQGLKDSLFTFVVPPDVEVLEVGPPG